MVTVEVVFGLAMFITFSGYVELAGTRRDRDRPDESPKLPPARAQRRAAQIANYPGALRVAHTFAFTVPALSLILALHQIQARESNSPHKESPITFIIISTVLLLWFFLGSLLVVFGARKVPIANDEVNSLARPPISSRRALLIGIVMNAIGLVVFVLLLLGVFGP